MAEVRNGTFKAKYVHSQKLETNLLSKRTALREINGNGCHVKNLSLKLNEKHQYQQNFGGKKVVCGKQNFQIYEDEDEEETQEVEENILPSSKSDSLESLPKEYQGISLGASEESPLLRALLKIKRSSSSSVWDTPYRKDIYSYFKSVEGKFQPNAKYMDKQSDITMNMRSVLVDWLVEVGEEYKLNVETLYLAVSYIDRFLSQMSVLRGKLQLVGTASMFLAAKYEEIYPPELKDFVYITDDTYSKKQILRMEHLILKVLNFDISVPTAYSFLHLYCSMGNASEVVIHLSQYICELSLLDGDPFLKFPCSIIAAGSLALANFTLGHDMWDEVLVEASGYQLIDLVHVISCLYNKYSCISSCPQQAISEKYKSSKFDCVSTIQVPNEIVFPDKLNS